MAITINYQPHKPNNPTHRSTNIKATSYIVSASTSHLKGLHYCTTGPGAQEPSGIPEARPGIFTPPSSPPLSAVANTATRSSGAAHTITEECERLFCGALSTIFLGERRSSVDPLVVGTVSHNDIIRSRTPRLLDAGVKAGLAQMTPPDEEIDVSGYLEDGVESLVREWIEMWDYTGGAQFRGFTAERPKDGFRSLFVFFEVDTVGKELKQALMALIELATTPDLSCEHLVIGLDRAMAPSDASRLVRDLGWIGFEALTLKSWAGGLDITSERWLLLGMEV